MGEQLATPEDLRSWLQLAPDDTGALPDDLAALVIGGVSSRAIEYCNRRSFAAVTETVRLAGSGTHEILLPGAPVIEVDEVVEDPDGADTTLIVGTDVEWDESGILVRVGGRWARRRRFYAVTFTHGYVDVPAGVRDVVCRVAARAISNPEGLATEGAGKYNAGFAFDETRLPTLSAPDRRDLDLFRL